MARHYVRAILLLILPLQAAVVLAQSSLPPLVVHEWGTFTSLQDEAGQAIGGINTDDEPVPAFVHRLSDMLLLTPTEVPKPFFQGAPACHPDVTLRLETPVLYFHLPEGESTLHDVTVATCRWTRELRVDEGQERAHFSAASKVAMCRHLGWSGQCPR